MNNIVATLSGECDFQLISQSGVASDSIQELEIRRFLVKVHYEQSYCSPRKLSGPSAGLQLCS